MSRLPGHIANRQQIIDQQSAKGLLTATMIRCNRDQHVTIECCQCKVRHYYHDYLAVMTNSYFCWQFRALTVVDGDDDDTHLLMDKNFITYAFFWKGLRPNRLEIG